ncbi:MAG: TonB-dependent receptor domain-containing protein [Novosphingobium sp.]
MRLGSGLAGALPGLIAALCAAPAQAQRTEENVTTQSADAFGRSVGSDRSGLYSSEDVRGFSPVEAGNARIEGLYFDQIDRLSPRIQQGTTVRVGVAALRYPFPAPTGLVDYDLVKPDGSLSFAAEVSSGSSFAPGLGGSLEFKAPLDGVRLGLSGGVGGRRIERVEGGQAWVLNGGGTLRWRPYAGAEVVAFGAVFLNWDEHARPTLFLAGDALPPEIERGVDLSQGWAKRDSVNLHFGAIARLPLGDWRLETGLFRARRTADKAFSDLMLGVTATGAVGNRTIIADGDGEDRSLSGEARLVRQWRSGSVAQQVIVSVRGRARDRRFGGSTRIALGPGSLLAPDPRPEPAYALGPKNRDRVRQITGGAAWSLVSDGGVTLDAGLSKSRYVKDVDFADPLAADPTSRDTPWLWNLGGAYALTPRLTLYAGASAGQEEAPIAPEIANNRAEAPPAIRTRQVEAGVKLALTGKLTLIAGVFRITKPYFNLDPALRYRRLGTLTNQGVELSLAGALAPGLTLVGGALFADPRISGEAVDAGQIGPSPVGQGRQRSVVNLDWRPDGGTSAWSFDLSAEGVSARTANARNTLRVPARATLGLGARYRFKLGKAKLLLRPVVTNVLDDYGWFVSPSGGLTYTQGRSATLQLTADF